VPPSPDAAPEPPPSGDTEADWKVRVEAAGSMKGLFENAHFNSLPSNLQTKDNINFFWKKYHLLKKGSTNAATQVQN
jgi:hypothetical protein